MSKKIHTSEIIYNDIVQSNQQGQSDDGFCGFYAYDETIGTVEKRPIVIVIHDWSGQNDFARNKAIALAEMGYIGFALDMYGNRQEGQTKEEKAALMQPLLQDRDLIAQRVLAAIHAAKSLSVADPNKIAVIGFCFGGLCALDLARTGISIAGVISFHGLLQASPLNCPKKIDAKILALHGYNDPMVLPEHVEDFSREMDIVKADWQLHIYGNTVHAFTNPLANDPAFGTVYNDKAAHRSWKIAGGFLREIFQSDAVNVQSINA